VRRNLAGDATHMAASAAQRKSDGHPCHGNASVARVERRETRRPVSETWDESRISLRSIRATR
jgi:hypothetical protein